MGKKGKNGDEEEVIIFLDEDGNEIILDEDFEEPAERFTEDLTYSRDELGRTIDDSEVELEEEYELEDDDFEDEEYAEDEESTSFFAGASNKLLVVLGGLIAVAAIVVGIVCIIGKTGGNDKVDFSNVGKNVAELGILGESKILEIAESKGADIDELNQAIANLEYDEIDEETGVIPVNITLTSILKDLKIKFVNSKDKLIANVPFEVEVTDPKGNVTKWTDTDKDGIIYQTDLAGGTYQVKLIPMAGYDAYYDFSANIQSLAVKTQLDYQKVDVKNEIKKSSQVAESEDAVKKETEVESKLKDTVSYVMSNRTSTSGFTAISKDTIENPLTALTTKNEASLFRFKRLSGPVNAAELDPSNNNPGEETPEPQFEWDGNVGTEGKHKEVKKDASGNIIDSKDVDCTYGTDNKCTVCGYEKPVAVHTHDYVWDGKAGTDGKHKMICNSSAGTCPEAEHEKYEECTFKNGACSICSAKTVASIAFSTVTTVEKGKTITLTATPSITPSSVKVKDFTWRVVSDSSVLTATDPTKKGTEGDYTSGSVTITGLKKGKTSVECKATLTNDTEVTSTIEITVTEVSIVLDRTAKKALFVGGDSFTLTAVTTGGATNKIEWSSSDASIAKIEAGTETANAEKGTRNVKITGLKEGTATITATSVDDNTIKASLTVVVCKHPKDDTSTKLVDKSGKQVYVYDSASKTYKEATYSDYYKGVDLFTAAAVVYTYTGWWTIDGKTYYFDKNGNKVTGDQVILGAKYSFGADGVLKSGTGLFGIDVSKWNGTIDWNKVAKSGVSYAIIRCGFRGTTVGGLVSDEKFATNIKNATDAGIKVGVYFFTQAISEAEAVEEASMCLSMVEGYKVSYPIFIDVENADNGRANKLSKSQRTDVVKAFCKTISNAGYKAGVYANKNWFTNYMNASDLTSYTIWLAQYASSPTYTTTRYDVWQYSSQGSISGISGDVDLDLSYLGY